MKVMSNQTSLILIGKDRLFKVLDGKCTNYLAILRHNVKLFELYQSATFNPNFEMVKTPNTAHRNFWRFPYYKQFSGWAFRMFLENRIGVSSLGSVYMGSNYIGYRLFSNRFVNIKRLDYRLFFQYRPYSRRYAYIPNPAKRVWCKWRGQGSRGLATVQLIRNRLLTKLKLAHAGLFKRKYKKYKKCKECRKCKKCKKGKQCKKCKNCKKCKKLRSRRMRVRVGSHLKKLINGRIALRSQRVCKFLSYFLPLGDVKQLSKSTYTSLSVNTLGDGIGKLDTLGFFASDLDYIPQIDFKNYAVGMVLTLFNEITTMHNLLSLNLEKNEQHVEVKRIPEARVISKNLFFKVFGVSGLRGERFPYPLVRFKPGYPTFFRAFRRNYAEMNHLRMARQCRLSKYLLRFKHLNNACMLNLTALSLKQVLLRTRVFSNLSDILYAIKCSFIFINARCCHLSSFQLQLGDCVQYKPAYITYSSVLDTFKSRLQILLNGDKVLCRYRRSPLIEGGVKGFYNSYGMRLGVKVFNRFHLQRLMTYYYTFFDVLTYVEIDYCFLGFIVVTLPRSAGDFDHITMRKSAATSIKMLNWKYIT